MGRPLLRDEVPLGTCKVRAQFSWSGESAQDLGFVEGDIIEVLNTGDGDWWTGKLKRNKMVGLFPRNFAEYVDENQPTMFMKERPTKPSRLGGYVLESNPMAQNTVSLEDLQITGSLNEIHSNGSAATGAAGSASKAANTPSSVKASLNSALGESTGSQRSTKSTQDILKDIGEELNRGFLDDVNLGMEPADLQSPDLGGNLDSFWGSLDDEAGKTPALQLNATDDGSSKPPPPPPPHTVSLSDSQSSRRHTPGHSRAQSLVPEDPIEDIASKPGYLEPLSQKPSSPNLASRELASSKPSSSALTGPVIHNVLPQRSSSHDSSRVSLPDPDSLSPEAPPRVAHSPSLVEEVPFDPKAFQPEKPIGDHIGSHFDNSAYTSPLAGDESEASVSVQKVRSKAHQSTVDKSSEPATVYFPTRNEPESRKNKFFQKLFPKNSQTLLGRSFSHSSQKSSKSSRSARSVKSTLRSMKSMFSFAPGFKPDADLYPTNTLKNDPMVVVAPSPGLGLSHGSASAPQGSGGPRELNSSVSGLPRSVGGGTNIGLGSSTSSGTDKKLESISSTTVNNKAAGGNNWIETHRDLYRARTLTERDMRKRKQNLELTGINCDDLVEPLHSQCLDEFHDYRLEDFEKVDHAVLTMSTWPQLMTPSVFASSRIGRNFADPVERLRAVFLLCAARISHVPNTPIGNNVMQSRQATPVELANTVKSMCDALDIECEVVEGHVRSAASGAKTIQSRDHAWNSVFIDGEWRFMDCVEAAADKSGDGEEDDNDINLFYFLTPPAQLIFSHVPVSQKRQYLTPPMPTATAALLPLASPSAFAHKVLFDNFWLGLTRLSDLDVGELSLSVPDASSDLVAFVDDIPALAQPYWENSRHFRIKAFVPPNKKQALLQIYVVPKSQTAREIASMELLWSVEMRHVSGGNNNAPYEFVGRYSAPLTLENDLYILEPQCKQLGGGETYTFRVEHFAATANNTQQPKLAIQSPSGRLTKLVPFGTDLHDTFRASAKTLEVGTWRAVVRNNDTESWVPFGEWFCS